MPISLETRTAAPMTAKEQQDHHRSSVYSVTSTSRHHSFLPYIDHGKLTTIAFVNFFLKKNRTFTKFILYLSIFHLDKCLS